MKASSGGMPRAVKIGGALVVVAGLVAAWSLLPVGAWIDAFRTWVKLQGFLGHVIFVLAYMVAAVILAPASALTLAAGFAFGLAGFPTVIIGATLGAGAAFLIGRYMARGWVERQMAGSPMFRAIDKAIESEGWKIVGLMRLSPLVPFNLQNYFFGATKVGFWPYLVTSMFGIMPGTLLYVWIGSLGATAGMSGAAAPSSDATTGMIKLVALGVGLLATAAVTVIVSRKASQKLREAGVEAGAA
jgi:uncharacterized membrane protein YdjX (TVP38/TMEM64 family)